MENLELLFEVCLKYKPDQLPVSLDGKIGEYIGSGDGQVDGPRIKGNVHWTLFEDENGTVCQSNLIGVIATPDGAQIWFDTMGYLIVPDQIAPHRRITTAAVRFETTDERYAWLNSLLGVWEGEFDTQTYRHRYRDYAQLR